MKKRLFLLAFIFTSITSNAQTAGLEKLSSYFKKDLKLWINSFINFHLCDFKRAETIPFENIKVEKFEGINDFYALYKPLLSFSSDKTRFIDIYSYQLNLVKKGNKLVAYPDIDQEIALCDLKRRTWKRIMFGGSRKWIEDVVWVSNTKFILAGIQVDKNETSHPEIFIGDINSMTLDIYLNDNKKCLQKKRYKNPKLEKMKIEGIYSIGETTEAKK